MPSSNANSQPGGVPPPLPASELSESGGAAALSGGSPPPRRTEPPAAPQSGRHFIAVLLSLCLGLFLADAVVSLFDDSLILFFGIHLLTGIRGVVFFFAILSALLVYVLMGLTPIIPKRWFLPVTLFNPVAWLLFIPGFIYSYDRVQQLSWVLSMVQVLFGLSILYWCRGSLSFRWPLVAESQLPARRFSWLNLGGFLLGNVAVLLPALVAYLFLCAALAVGHYSAGFLALRPGGVMVRVRDYVRQDGKTIQLVPMAHVGDPDFYHNVSQSFPSNSVVLMEGVTDNRNLITNQVNYERMATSLGLAEQHKEFTPERGEWVRADVDVEQFSTNTIGFLNLAMLVHAKGVNSETVLKLMQESPPPQIMEQIFDDIIKKRNRHLLDEIQTRLPQSDHLIVPWGAAHMPGLATEIQKSGFRLHKSRDFQVIRFGAAGTKNKSVQPVPKAARPEVHEENQGEVAPK